jgi:hypothetical protein
MTLAVLVMFLVIFSSFTALNREFTWLYCMIFYHPLRHSPPTKFISHRLFAALASTATISHTSFKQNIWRDKTYRGTKHPGDKTSMGKKFPEI